MYSDEVGADALPMRFVAAALLMGILISISASALADFVRDWQVTRFSADLAALEDRAATIYQQGGARTVGDPGDSLGTKETVRLRVPASVEILVLGAMPSQQVPVTSSPHEQNIIYFTTYKGITTTLTSGARYASGPDLDRPVVLIPGTYELTCELVRDRDGTFITLT